MSKEVRKEPEEKSAAKWKDCSLFFFRVAGGARVNPSSFQQQV